MALTYGIRLQYGTTRTYEGFWEGIDDVDFVYYRCGYKLRGDTAWRHENGWSGSETDKDHPTVKGLFKTSATVFTLPAVPDNAYIMYLEVRPVAKVHKKNGVKVQKWSYKWADLPNATYECGEATSTSGGGTTGGGGGGTDYTPPSAPSISLDGYTLMVSTNVNSNDAVSTVIQLYRDGEPFTYQTPSIASNRTATSWFSIYRNGTYKARAFNHCNSNYDSDWGEYSSEITVDFTPSNNFTIEQSIVSNQFRAQINNLPDSVKTVEFELVRDDTTLVYTLSSGVNYSTASVSAPIIPGSKYKVRARVLNPTVGLWSAFSNYTSNLQTPPSTPASIKSCKATSSTSVELTWDGCNGATGYTIEYTDHKNYFDTSSDVQSTTSKTTTANITGLATGKEWFFRVCATNDGGSSGWSSLSSVPIGEKPDIPQTWSDRTTTETGKSVTLCWMHNSKDNSIQHGAKIELSKNGTVLKTIQIDGGTDKASTYKLAIDTTFKDGDILTWRVCTRGILPDYSDWSVSRQISIYEAPSVVVKFENQSLSTSEKVFHYPIKMVAEQYPKTQTPMDFYVELKALTTHESYNYAGETIIVSEGTVLYSKHYYDKNHTQNIEITPYDTILVPYVSYEVSITVSTSVGLTSTWTDQFKIEPSGKISIDCERGGDTNRYSVVIRPRFVINDTGEIKAKIYRINSDNTFTLIAEDISGDNDLFYTDPHPALDYGRYRIVATSEDGVMEYLDPPPYPIHGDSVIIQWGREVLTPFGMYDDPDDDSTFWTVDKTDTGYFLSLPYNIDISDNISQDVEHVQYIGRKHPVSYHGTQLGETSTWNIEVPMEDTETLSLLRQLRVYMGNVYVREPSGSGYWATVAVSYSRKHNELTMPVTLTITRVEGDETLNTVGEKVTSSPIIEP